MPPPDIGCGFQTSPRARLPIPACWPAGRTPGLEGICWRRTAPTVHVFTPLKSPWAGYTASQGPGACAVWPPKSRLLVFQKHPVCAISGLVKENPPAHGVCTFQPPLMLLTPGSPRARGRKDCVPLACLPVLTTGPASSFNPLPTRSDSVRFRCDLRPFPICFQLSVTQFLLKPLPVIGRRARSRERGHGEGLAQRAAQGWQGEGGGHVSLCPPEGHRP